VVSALINFTAAGRIHKCLYVCQAYFNKSHIDSRHSNPSLSPWIILVHSIAIATQGMNLEHMLLKQDVEGNVDHFFNHTQIHVRPRLHYFPLSSLKLTIWFNTIFSSVLSISTQKYAVRSAWKRTSASDDPLGFNEFCLIRSLRPRSITALL